VCGGVLCVPTPVCVCVGSTQCGSGPWCAVCGVGGVCVVVCVCVWCVWWCGGQVQWGVWCSVVCAGACVVGCACVVGEVCVVCVVPGLYHWGNLLGWWGWEWGPCVGVGVWWGWGPQAPPCGPSRPVWWHHTVPPCGGRPACGGPTVAWAWGTRGSSVVNPTLWHAGEVGCCVAGGGRQAVRVVWGRKWLAGSGGPAGAAR